MILSDVCANLIQRMKIALCQINPTVGDIGANTAAIQRDLEQAGEAGAELAVFPEMAILGYPPKDLLLKPSVIRECQAAVESLADQCRGIAAVIGYPTPSDTAVGRLLYNAAAFCQDGRIAHRHVKSLLPTYDVFDETRYFEPGPTVDVVNFNGIQLGISICEDLWNDSRVFPRQLYHDNPIHLLAQRGAQLFVNAAASPYVLDKHPFRLRLMSEVARHYGLPVVYCNQVGGNDELVFDGASCAFDAQGQVLGHAEAFKEDLLIVEVPLESLDDSQQSAVSPTGDVLPSLQTSEVSRDHPMVREPASAAVGEFVNVSPSAGRVAAYPVGVAGAFEALVLGLRDYCGKCGFQSIVLGLSGGIDSAVTAVIAVMALGSDKVRGISMPSRYSSQGSKSDAQQLAENLGIAYHTVPIAQVHEQFEAMLTPHFEGRAPDTTEENLQARARGVVLMAMSNKFGSLLVTTGNKSELAVGYCTLYGDMAGGLAVLSDVPKTMVYDMSRWINTSGSSVYQTLGKPVIPEDSITKPPSAELRPDQTDQDSLPDYDVLDEIVERYVEQEQSARRIIDKTGFDADTVLRIVRLIDLNEYKRKQAAPGLKITGRAFGFGRRMPIAQRYDNRRAFERTRENH